MLKAAFMFLAPKANSQIHNSVIKTDEVELFTVGVPNYEIACKTALELISGGITAIELCGGFGYEGVAQINKVVQGKIPIGVVRFDVHPGLGNKSGDEVF